MPNWCHNTLWVTGDPEELAVFVEAARPKEDRLRKEWDAEPREWERLNWRDNYESFGAWVREQRERQPLSFDSIVPMPAEDVLAEWETHQPCTMCGALGVLPRTESEAEAHGAKWYEWMAKREDRTCNVCLGTGEERTGMPGWYEWAVVNWGTKWDASFDGPLYGVMVGDHADVKDAVDSQGMVETAHTVVYKFDTAWAPPEPFVENAAHMYPKLTFTLRYAEAGMDFAGESKWENGLRVSEEELRVEDVLAPEELWY